MFNFSFSSPAIPVHVHSVDQTMDEFHQTVDRKLPLDTSCLTNMEPFLKTTKVLIFLLRLNSNF